jgi:hypothetical protein
MERLLLDMNSYLATMYLVAVSIPTVATTIQVGLNSIPSLVDGRYLCWP